MKRNIVEISRELCNGCGLCASACAEGALELDGEGKAVLIRDIYCDGLGACLDVCPTGALKVVEKDAFAYDEDATSVHVTARRGPDAAAAVHRRADKDGPGHGPGRGCPGSMARSFAPAGRLAPSPATASPCSGAASELGQWPIQLHLVSPAAPYFRACDLLVAADCTAFALGSFHAELLRGKALVIACPKLDRCEGYVEKLAAIIAENQIYSLTLAIMELPCCSGLSRIVQAAIERSGKPMTIQTIIVGMDGRRR